MRPPLACDDRRLEATGDDRWASALSRSRLLPLLGVWLASTAAVVAQLPDLPERTNDSQSYIELWATRPPAYGWLLHGFQALGGGADFAGLPLVQTLLIALALLAFAVQFARLLDSQLAGAVVVVLVWAHVGTFEAASSVMSEGLFLPATLAGLACAIAYARRAGLLALVGASACFGLAFVTRTAGAALLLLPVLLVLLDARLRPGAAARRVGLAAGVAVALTLAGMTANRVRHGHFEIGSMAGTSLLGKAMLLLRPTPEQDPVLAQMAALAAQAREAVAVAPDFAASLRAQAQAYEELRWRTFFPAAEAAWPELAGRDERVRSMVAGRVARAVIAADPLGYLRLAARDWTGLVIYPHFWPTAWTAASSPHPFFASCATDDGQCWIFYRQEAPRYYGLAMLATSLAGLAAIVVLVVGWSGRALRRTLAPAERVMLALAVIAQASLAATALFEVGLWRYPIAVHAMHTALAIWLAALALRAAKGLRFGRPAT